jgi:WD40 repeat protein
LASGVRRPGVMRPFVPQRFLRYQRVARIGVTLVGIVTLIGSVEPVQAQYFGRNKVQYETFGFRVMQTPHFSVHFYPEAERATHDAARMLERWYSRQSALLNHTFSNRRPIILYANQPDFQQTTVIGGELTEATGGVTEGLRERVVLPFTGSYADNDHVIGHELVHVFQYNIAFTQPNGGGLAGISQLPLWLVEGMAEYLSVGREDPHTAMWMRDAVLRNSIPTIDQLTNDPNFFPYRYGQALWAYIGGQWGDHAVPQIYRAALQRGWDRAVRTVTGRSSDSLSREWSATLRAHYTPLLSGRTLPSEVGDRIVMQGERGGEMNISPVLSPDGRYVAFFSARSLFGIDLYIADAQTGRVIRQLGGPTGSTHIDAISFIYSAGAWSPDGKRLSAIVYARGNNEIAIVNASSGRVERRIRVPNVTAIYTTAWSPDGSRLAISGGRGGISDLYVYELATGSVTQLTNDKYADLHPTWSPDGRTIAFATDRGSATNFDELRFSSMQLALIDIATRNIRVLSIFPIGKHINPQFSPDGGALFFISDQDGFSDVYRVAVPVVQGEDEATGQITRQSAEAITRITRVATGVSGVTELSPAITVSPGTGRLLFSVFENQGYSIYGLDPNRLQGAPVTSDQGKEEAGLLPPAQVASGGGTVTTYLRDPLSGLPPSNTDFPINAYRPTLRISGLGQPTLGVATGQFGTAIGGGVAVSFSDMLENHVVGAALQVGGTLKDIGGEVIYLNQRRRWNWIAGASHIPYLTGFTFAEGVPVQIGNDVFEGVQLTQVLERVYVTQARIGTQYPFSTTRRFELSLSGNHYGFGAEIQRIIAVGGQIVQEIVKDTTAAPSLTFAQANAAFVGDNSYFGFTSPIAGGRYRFEVSPTAGQLQFAGVLADYRRYFFIRPVTLAFRGLHFGRYGKDGESDRISSLFVGDPALVRGYDASSFDVNECTTPSSSEVVSLCPEFDRLIGSRIAVVNAELRIPLAGPTIGLIRNSVLPIELAPFIDAGVAWTRSESPRFRFSRRTAERIPVVSAGISARINLFGYIVGEVFYARPFQRPNAGGEWGFQLIPGW